MIVVADQPNTGECFDALDHGAANYCSEPLEESEVLWTLAGALRGFETCAAHITEP